MDEQLNTRLMAWVSFFNDPLWDFWWSFWWWLSVLYTSNRRSSDSPILTQYPCNEGQP